MLQVNLLVSTSVAEEGLDITECQLVLRFDLPKTEAAYIQSRGRARKENSVYVMFVERNNTEMVEQVSHLAYAKSILIALKIQPDGHCFLTGYQTSWGPCLLVLLSDVLCDSVMAPIFLEKVVLAESTS